MLVFIQPTLLVYEKRTKPNIAILIDSSSSMKFGNRFEKMRNIINKNLSELKKYFYVSLYNFSSNINMINEQKLYKMYPDGNFTDIGNSLEQLKRSEKNKIDAIVLFSDGQHNTTTDINNIIQGIKIPIFTVYPDEEKNITDISIADLRISDYGYKNIPIELKVIINTIGIKYGEEITVFLKYDNNIISTQKTKIGSLTNEIEFKFIPTKLGLHTYTVEIPPYPGEEIITNNIRKFNIEIIKEKTRILFISGQPSSEYFFLRYFLKSDPSIELVSFMILRNPENIAVVPDEQLSLIPFPINEIFLKDLFNYDIFVLENFNPARFGIHDIYLDNIVRFVKEKGGSLLVIGGDNSFGKGYYKPLEQILPVILDNPEEKIEEGLFTPRILDYNHPITALNENIKQNEKIWAELPQLDSCHRLRPKKGATVLAVHPFSKTEQGNLVVISCADYGKGRTLAIGTNTTWRWALGAGEKNMSSEYYFKFWKNVFNWLSQSAETKNFRISIIQKKYYVGDEMELKLIVLDDKMKSHQPELHVIDPYMKKQKITELIPISNGWITKFIPNNTGKYLFNAKLIDINKIIATDSQNIFVSDDITTEDTNLNINRQLMEKIASINSGLCFSLSEFSAEKITTAVSKTIHPVIKTQIKLTNLPYLFIAIIILLCIEWTISRLRGLW